MIYIGASVARALCMSLRLNLWPSMIRNGSSQSAYTNSEANIWRDFRNIPWLEAGHIVTMIGEKGPKLLAK